MLAHIWLSWTTKITLPGRAGAPASLVMVRAQRNAPRERNWVLMEIARCVSRMRTEKVSIKTLQGMERVLNVNHLCLFCTPEKLTIPVAAKLESSGLPKIVTSSLPPTGSVTRVLLGNTRRIVTANIFQSVSHAKHVTKGSIFLVSAPPPKITIHVQIVPLAHLA